MTSPPPGINDYEKRGLWWWWWWWWMVVVWWVAAPLGVAPPPKLNWSGQSPRARAIAARIASMDELLRPLAEGHQRRGWPRTNPHKAATFGDTPSASCGGARRAKTPSLCPSQGTIPRIHPIMRQQQLRYAPPPPQRTHLPHPPTRPTHPRIHPPKPNTGRETGARAVLLSLLSCP